MYGIEIKHGGRIRDGSGNHGITVTYPSGKKLRMTVPDLDNGKWNSEVYNADMVVDDGPKVVKLTERDRIRDASGDLMIHAELPDGKRINVAIPGWDQGAFDWTYEEGKCYSLNLVTDRHYT